MLKKSASSNTRVSALNPGLRILCFTTKLYGPFAMARTNCKPKPQKNESKKDTIQTTIARVFAPCADAYPQYGGKICSGSIYHLQLHYIFFEPAEKR